jgi:hypothetical protein
MKLMLSYGFGDIVVLLKVFGMSYSLTCVDCAKATTNWTTIRSMRNFLSPKCEVVVNHTTMRCIVPPGVGQNHTWQVYVGVQDSAPLNQSSTAYARPQLQFIAPISGPTQAMEVERTTIEGRYLGSPELGIGKVHT